MAGLGLAPIAARAAAGPTGGDLVVGGPDNLTGLDPPTLNNNLSQSAARLRFEGLYILANLAWYSDPATDAAIEEGLSTVDPGIRAAAYAKAQALVWKDSLDRVGGGA